MSASVDAEVGSGDRLPNIRRDIGLVGVVGVAFIAARVLTQIPVLPALGLLSLGLAVVQPRILLLAALVLIGARSGHELATLQPADSRPVAWVAVELVDDPRPYESVWRVQVDLAGERLMLEARASSAAALRAASAGDTMTVSGTVRGQRPQSSWAVSRRIVGRLTANVVHDVDHAGGLFGAANATRATVRSGAASMSASRRVLFTGLVFGDDRQQNPIVEDNFRAAGLGHLLAVSGQNVVFVLLLAAPVLGRIRSIPVRLAASAAVLIWFGFLTRFEPSVTRALVMAGLALVAHAIGRPADAATILPPAVIGLLVFDPLLAWSLAFQLSVAATAGLIVLTPHIAERLRGPAILRMPMAATMGAQLAVSPILLSSFGRISLIAVPANLLAAPAAAGVMMWGLAAGGLAGLSPDALATAIHLPTRSMLWWIDRVASVAARVPVGQFGAVHLIVLCTGVIAYTSSLMRTADPLTIVRRFVGSMALLAVVLPLAVPRTLSVGEHRFANGITIFRGHEGHDIVLLESGVRPGDALESLRTARIGQIDLLITMDGSRSAGRNIHTLAERFTITEIWAPLEHQVPGARSMVVFQGAVGSLVVETTSSGRVVVGPA